MKDMRTVQLASQLITRPADTTAYASGDLVANSTTAGSVTPFKFSAVTRQIGYRSKITRVGLLTSQALIANGTFRVHLFGKAPTVTNGDNGALDVATNLDSYLGWMELVLGIIGTGQGAFGWSSPFATAAPGGAVHNISTSQDAWGLLEARAAYVPASAQTFKLFANVEQS